MIKRAFVVYRKHIDFVTGGGVLSIFWSRKGDAEFLFVFHCNITSVVQRFLYYELFCLPEMAILLKGRFGYFPTADSERCPQLYIIFTFIWHFLSIFNGSEVIWLFFFGWNSILSANVRGFWGKSPIKRQCIKKTLAGRHFLASNCVYLFMFQWHFVSILYCLDVIPLYSFGWDFSIWGFWGSL